MRNIQYIQKSFCSQIVKTYKVNELQAMRLRYSQKEFHRHPKQTQHYKSLKRDVEHFLFQFHCDYQTMNFEHKLEILDHIVQMRPDQVFSDILGITEVIKSINRDLVVSSYIDGEEFNVSQFINLLHQIQYYDKGIWISAIDNYHKQSNLNWDEYRNFTNSIFHFSNLLDEQWQRNIVKDITQETLNDFTGFLEHSFRLGLDHQDLYQTYLNIRKFDPRITSNNLKTVIQFYGKSLEKRKDNKLSPMTYKLILRFIFDHVRQKELLEQIEKLFSFLLRNIQEDYDNFTRFHELIQDEQSYLSTMKLAQENYFHHSMDEHITINWSNSMYMMFMQRQIKEELYQSIDYLMQLKLMVIALKESFFTREQVQMMVQMIDQFVYENLKEVKQIKQNIFSIVNFHKTLIDEDQAIYLQTLIKAKLTVNDVYFSNTDLIKCLKELDGSDMVYYVSDFIESALTYVADNTEKFDPEDWCFVYYITYKYLADEESQTLIQNLNILKQYIRLHYSTNYRRWIPIESHYYKILSVVKMEEFMADDISNYY